MRNVAQLGEHQTLQKEPSYRLKQRIIKSGCRWFESNHSSLDAITAKIKRIIWDYNSKKCI